MKIKEINFDVPPLSEKQEKILNAKLIICEVENCKVTYSDILKECPHCNEIIACAICNFEQPYKEKTCGGCQRPRHINRKYLRYKYSSEHR